MHFKSVAVMQIDVCGLGLILSTWLIECLPPQSTATTSGRIETEKQGYQDNEWYCSESLEVQIYWMILVVL